jgi:FAD/FMN-containing dehydrogenase
MRSAFVDELDDGAIAATVERHRAVPSPSSEIHFHHFGGAVARVGDDESAFGNRSAEYVLNVIARSPEADGFEEIVAWARGTTDALAPVSREGAYVNFMGDARDERLRAAYGHAKYERLVDLKRQYDPTNLFRLNQNIAP